MVSEPRLDQAQISQIAEGVTALAASPFVILAATAIKQPFVQTAIREGVALSERLKETAAETGEIFEDLVAEARAELAQERLSDSAGERTEMKAGESEMAQGVSQVLSTLDQEIGRATNGIVDLRMLMPLGFSALALRQLLVKGVELETIPWYVLAWYAFDSFMKLNKPDPSPVHSSVSNSQQFQSLPNGEASQIEPSTGS